MNGEQAWMQKKNIVFSVDQEPFDDGGKWFCFLYPLMTLEGDRLQAASADFPNTGRIWWMIGDYKVSQAVPGAIWTGPIEEHPGWSKSKDNPRHNRFQARKDAIRQGGPDLIELIQLPHMEPTPELIYRGNEIPLSKPPCSLAFLCGNEFILGPLKTNWDAERLSATFEAIVIREFDPDNAVILRTPLSEFRKLVRVEEFRFEARQLDYSASPTPISIALTKKAWMQLEPLREASEEFDGLKDNELINWAVRTVEDFQLSRQEKRQLNKFLEQAQRLSAPSHEVVYQRRLRRLAQIADDVGRIEEFGPEVAEILGRSVFEGLVQKHQDELVAGAVQKEIQRKRKEIDEAIRLSQKKLEQIDVDFEKRKQEHQEELQRLSQEHEQEIEQQRQNLRDYEESLNERQRMLDQAQHQFHERAHDLFQEWLLMFPFLQGMHSTPTVVSVQAAALPEAPSSTEERFGQSEVLAPSESKQIESPCLLPLPAFLNTSRFLPDAPAISEEQFLEQFKNVVKEEGFLFENDDLYNFHVCIKTGYLTILAGRTGMGKSSLPWLYAKALGCESEFLHVSVRPDWLDDRDLLGAFNAIARRFEPAPSGFTERLICAQKDWEEERGGIYLVCLDEMNLARVEHYFAQFLSMLEKPERQRVIHLFGSGLVQHSDPYAPFKDLRLRDNIRFIGTVNIDETAFFFSPKVLDRAEVVVFQDPDLAASMPAEARESREILPVSLQAFQQWQHPIAQADAARPFLIEIDRILRNSRLGFGFRQFDRMLSYIACAQGILEPQKAIDFQLMQVVLPRLRRTAPHFYATLDALIEKVDEKNYPRSAEMLNRIRESEGEDDFFQLI